MMHIVTIVDSISETSMPVNEFVIFRSKHKYKLRQTLIVMTKNNDNLIIPENIQVLYFNNNVLTLYRYIKKILKEDRANVVFHLHQPKSSIMFYMATICLKCWNKTLFTVHSSFSDRDVKYKLSSAFCAMCSRKVVCVSKTAYLTYSSFVKALKDELYYIRNGVDYERVNKISFFSKDTCNSKNINNLVYIARFIPIKNHAFLINLMKKLPHQKLFLIGQEDAEFRIRRMAEEEGVIDRIVILGKIPRDYVFEIISKSRIYLSPSMVEGLPISVLEAMSLGLIPILSDIAPHREIKHVCKDVEILPYDVELWKKKILDIVNYDEDIVKLKANKIKNQVRDNFSLKKMNDEYVKAYKELLMK